MKKMSAYALTGALALTLAFAAGAVVNPQTADAKVKVKKVTVVAPSGKTAYVAKGKKVKLSSTVKVTPNKKANKKVTYKSANKKIATVTSKGVIKAKAAGKTKITVVSKKNKKKKATIKVVVKKKAVKKVKLNSGNFVLAAGAKKTLKAKVSPTKNVSKKVAWTSSNKRVATVSSKGVVKGIRDGKAVITAKATDGSGKKAKVTVTVGAGIASVSVPTGDVVRVVLSGTKTLTAKDFTIQTRSGQTSTRYISKPVSSVSTKDQKVYDVTLKGYVSSDTYLKVSIPTLATNKSLEIYIDKIAGYGNGTNDTVEYVTSVKDKKYSNTWSISNTNAVGKMTYSAVTGLPAGLKSYISQDKTTVRVRGKFTNMENGTTATLTGVDEKGTTFTKKVIFYVGDADHLVGGAEPADTKLSYTPNDPKTPKNEESGFDFYNDLNVWNYIHVSGGSGDYSREVTCNGKSLYELTHNTEGDCVPMPAGTYNFNVTIKDDEKENVSPLSLVVTIILKDGVTVSGTVRDLAGQPAKDVEVGGHTKEDAYGRCQSLYAETETNGTYSTRVLPGDYYTYCNGGYDMTVGNIFTGNTTKNFVIPLYRVTIATNIPGAVAYNEYPNIDLIDNYGRIYSVFGRDGSMDGDFSMYAYLEPGTYSVDEYYTNTVYAYGKVDSYTDTYGRTVYNTSNSLGNYKVSGSFSVTGNGTVTLNAVKNTDDE
ncbi:MAG: Ig-like domain-containing protein [Eubacterium sp.]|nr:Ig-like domain-containing protein [Eubacterium sp.]